MGVVCNATGASGYTTASIATLPHSFQDNTLWTIRNIYRPTAKVDINLISPFSDISLVVVLFFILC